MSGKRARLLRATVKRPQRPAKSNRAKRIALLAMPLVLIATLATGYFTFFGDKPAKPVLPSAVRPAKVVRSAKTLDDLLKIPADRLGDVDIAEINLLCATGLPGAEKLDIDHALATLDDWAKRVKFETDRHLYRVTDPRYAEHYRHSEAYLRAEMLLQALQVDLGVKYDLAARYNFSFKDSRVAFIHGMIPVPGQPLTDTPGGTCASMPVMYVAVGRRLGYPLKLVTTKGHVFVRWDGKDHFNPAWRERFNIEGSGDGFSSFDDAHYKTWPFKLTDKEVKANRYLVSLTPTEEFAEFLAARGHCGSDNGQPAFAARCYENAYGYDPSRPCYRAWFGDAALLSGYRPHIPVLASLLARRRQPSVLDPESIVANQQAAARREWLRTHPGDPTVGGLPNGIPAGVPPTPIGPRQPQPTTPGVPQLPSPYGLSPAQPGALQPGASHPHQPYQPPIAGQPPR
jgi:tetratricopeptide (TPR) repeat protein